MTYSNGLTIQAADYNSLAGATGTAASSGVAAQNRAGYLWGVGYGDRGYGQTIPALSPVSASNVDQGWTNLQGVLSGLASWHLVQRMGIP